MDCRVLAVLAAIQLSACSDPKSRKHVAELEERVKTLEIRTEVLSGTVQQLKTTLEAQAWDVAGLKGGSMAILESTSTGYSIAKTEFAPFAVVLEKAEPYLDGFKLKLRIGNITSATFSGAKLKIRWTPAATQVAQATQGDPSPNEKEISLTQDLRPGAYTPVEVIVTPATAQDIRWIAVGIDTDNMRLARW